MSHCHPHISPVIAICKTHLSFFVQAILPDKEIYFLKLFNNWLESAREDLMDMFSVHTVEEIVVRNMY